MKIHTKLIYVIDHRKTGDAMRQFREQRKISLREIARRMEKSAAYISDLELGRRNWTEAIFLSYEKAIKTKTLSTPPR